MRPGVTEGKGERMERRSRNDSRSLLLISLSLCKSRSVRAESHKRRTLSSDIPRYNPPAEAEGKEDEKGGEGKEEEKEKAEERRRKRRRWKRRIIRNRDFLPVDRGCGPAVLLYRSRAVSSNRSRGYARERINCN